MISTPGTRFPRAVREPSSAFACGVSLGHAFPAGVSYLTFQSAGTSFLRGIAGKLALLLQFVYSLAVPSIFRQKGSRIALAPNQDFKSKLVYPSCFFTVILKGWKKFARLLPNNWVAEPPQPFTGEEARQAVGGKGADFWNQLECNFKKKLKARTYPEASLR
ncbi:hypothetical protein OCO53_19080 [Peribacillus frigoritolerans]|uniref:hypothetical protein n=1 Tax=Peribacillus frigoritolerans TaxID=450367 RepID=UPI0021D103BC|nr:hypothetical protein [Peribacillus frigoritolerans]MCU6602575.1 hypothetical protein [Peribacillus frigoritolerans]